MIDTHCHLETLNNIDEVVNKMEGNKMITAGTDLESNKKVLELTKKYKNVYGVIGYHPEFADNIKEEDLEFLEHHINDEKIVGIGEIGLDYYYSKENKEKQIELFKKQIKLAKKYNKTIVIHSREALEDTYNILKEENIKDLKVVMHCYSGSKEMALRFKEFNMKFGIGGVVTFKNASKLKEVVKTLELSDLLLETDTPYLTPEPYRGKINEPYNIIYVAKEIAKIKEIELEKVLKETTNNAISQFDLT